MYILYSQLLATHKAELDGLEKSLDLDRERQLAALREKLEAKRGQRLDDQTRKQELSIQKELLEQKKELEQVQNKQVCLLCVLSWLYIAMH